MRVEALTVQQLQADLSRNHDRLNDIEARFDDITAGNVLDRPLDFEWNVWRALSYLDAGEVRPNFTMDRTGQPIFVSSGVPDIDCHYPSFHLIVDVTTSYGTTQANMEGEPVPRHVGLFQQQCRTAGDQRPVHGLFVALRLADTVRAMFFAWHQIRNSCLRSVCQHRPHGRGYVPVVPLGRAGGRDVDRRPDAPVLRAVPGRGPGVARRGRVEFGGSGSWYAPGLPCPHLEAPPYRCGRELGGAARLA